MNIPEEKFWKMTLKSLIKRIEIYTKFKSDNEEKEVYIDQIGF